MSMPTRETISCPECGHEQEFTLWRSVNVTLDPELKDKLIDGRLTTCTCDGCGYETQVVFSLLYHDMDRKLVVWLVPGDEEEPEGTDVGVPDELRDMIQRGYTHRFVRSSNELIEKVLIFDDQLDDRMIEFFKAVLRIQMEQVGDTVDGLLLYSGLTEDPAEGKQMDLALFSDAAERSLTVPWDVYLKFAAEYVNALPDADEERGHWLRVDEDYALSLLQG